ncbi:hypothetical protein MAIT1_03930 [Magnetofaba australis IT-1]|uniref:Tetratricopeptide repeat protein n=2 Tax=Magnetofaba TaxID=1472292 RepID=A0A1Y2K8Z9_9PROT|nr:hypothetical protein MAIT1_03930 [Magnetofaba australis IT-1]
MQGQHPRENIGDKDRNGQPLSTITCRQRRAEVRIAPKVVAVETGRILYSQTLSASRSSQYCPGDKTGLTRGQTLLDQAMTEVMDDYRKAVAPYEKEISIDLMEEPLAPLAAHPKALLDRGLAFVRADRLERGCELWRQARREGGENSPVILYNLGVCSEMSGRLQGALDLYLDAERMLLEPSRPIAEGIKRTRAALDRQHRGL